MNRLAGFGFPSGPVFVVLPALKVHIIMALYYQRYCGI